MKTYVNKMSSRKDFPTVSVVITCYNYARYLAECLESVLAQTFNDLEIVVLNDGSTDNTDEVISPFLYDSRIRYIKQKNSGQACAKNTGIRVAQGSFIAFLDADDYWEPTKLEKQMPLFNDSKVGVIYSTSKYIDEEGKELPWKNTMKYLQPQRGWVTRYLLFDNFVVFSSSVVKKEVFQNIGFFDETLGMAIDWDLWLRTSVCYKFEYVSEPLLAYRVGHSGQMSNNLEKRHVCSDLVLERFIRNNPHLVTTALQRRITHYTFMNRGLYFREINMGQSAHFFLKAFFMWPFSIAPFRCLAKNALMVLSRVS